MCTNQVSTGCSYREQWHLEEKSAHGDQDELSIDLVLLINLFQCFFPRGRKTDDGM